MTPFLWRGPGEKWNFFSALKKNAQLVPLHREQRLKKSFPCLHGSTGPMLREIFLSHFTIIKIYFNQREPLSSLKLKKNLGSNLHLECTFLCLLTSSSRCNPGSKWKMIVATAFNTWFLCERFNSSEIFAAERENYQKRNLQLLPLKTFFLSKNLGRIFLHHIGDEYPSCLKASGQKLTSSCIYLAQYTLG